MLLLGFLKGKHNIKGRSCTNFIYNKAGNATTTTTTTTIIIIIVIVIVIVIIIIIIMMMMTLTLIMIMIIIIIRQTVGPYKTSDVRFEITGKLPGLPIEHLN